MTYDYDSCKKDFVKTLNSLAGLQKPYQIFRDWLEMAAISFHQIPYHAQELPIDDAFTQLEEKYLQVAKRYTSEQLSEFSTLNSLVILAMRDKPCDFLGEIYMDQGFASDRSGQFFTPYHLSVLLAKMNLINVPALVQEKGIITISDPACGAGGMLIAAAMEAIEQEYDPRSVMQFDAIDIDRDCFNMTYIQLSALDLQAVVHHGNTLSMEMYETRVTMQLKLFEKWLQEQQAIAQEQQRVQAMLSFLRDVDNPMSDDDVVIEQQPLEETPIAVPAPSPQPVRAKKADIVLRPEQLSLFDLEGFQQR